MTSCPGDAGVMKPPHFDENALLPLTTAERIEGRVVSLVGRASRRQVWFLFVNSHDRQLPLILPIEDHPSMPGAGDATRFARVLTQVGEATGAAGVIFVIERWADNLLTPSDLAWANALHSAAVKSTLGLRGVLLSHTRGVRWVAPDDYLFADPP